VTISDLEALTLTIYVREDQLGQVQLGQAVSVTVDAYPGRVFAGAVQSISSQAEFTPKNVQTQEERANMVFAVKVSLPNPDHALKPGMPADALLSEVIE
jgi:multidrug resistance efflux pump